MFFVWDSSKARANLAKHGIALDGVRGFDFETALIRVDERRDYGERRLQAHGLIGNRLHVLVFTRRGEAVRVISLRPANRAERTRYTAWVNMMVEPDD